MIKNICWGGIALISLLSAGCTKNDSYVKTEGMIWNTLYHITFKGPEALQDSILPILNEVSHSLSIFEPSSLVSQLNNADSVKADAHLEKVYTESRKINHLSQGRFDPTLSPLITAWGFGIGHTPNSDTIPSAIDSIMHFVGIDKTRLIDGFIVKDDYRTQFNFSAIAKGYGCDAVGQMFRRNGVNDFMVEIGGEISLSGLSPSHGKWKIAIDVPSEDSNPGHESVMVLELTDAGLATSGNYRNYRLEGDKKLAHTISPVDGKPFFSEILSASVIASSCMEADALATACMASPLEDAKTLLLNSGAQGLLITTDSIWTTPSFAKYLAP